MSSYETIQKELAAGTPAEAICATCDWTRLCVQPPDMTERDVDQRIAEAEAQDLARDPGGGRPPVAMLLTAVVLADRTRSGRMCPVFAARLRGDRNLADSIRNLMRSYQDVHRGKS